MREVRLRERLVGDGPNSIHCLVNDAAVCDSLPDLCDDQGAELEETILRYGETERKRITLTMDQLAKDTALAAGITVASCQGKTLGRTRVQGIMSEHMKAENLIVCTNRTRTLADLRCEP